MHQAGESQSQHKNDRNRGGDSTGNSQTVRGRSDDCELMPVVVMVVVMVMVILVVMVMVMVMMTTTMRMVITGVMIS